MALNVTNLLTVVGKYVKTINTWNGYITALETAKDDIYTVLDNENLQDLYVDLPAQFEGFKSAVASWISTAISEIEDLLTDETYVLEELPIFSSDVTTVLNAIFDKMTTDNDTIKSSVVSLGGSDVDQNHTSFTGSRSSGRLFVTRILDGVSDPSSLVDAHTSYNNVEGQLAMSCDTFGKVTSSSIGAEVVQLFADSPSQASYSTDTESPGVGPTISNLEQNVLSLSNYDFSSWSGDNPTSWTLAGGSAGTDWIDSGGSGSGPLTIDTAGVTVKQQVTGLTRRKMYFFAALVSSGVDGTFTTVDWKFRVENVDGATVHKNFGTFQTDYADQSDPTDIYDYVYGFYCPNDDVNLNDIYICLEYDAEADSSLVGYVYKIIVTDVTYFNGLGWTFWNPHEEESTTDIAKSPLLVNDYTSISVSNNNGGVFQTFFRRAFNIQLPTADSPTISDTLAT